VSQSISTLILCGGRGTRSYPFTEHFPKVMMPIGGTPVIVHLMRIYAQQGFTNFVLAAGHRQEILMDYFSGRFSEWSVKIVDTGEDADTGERVARCQGELTDCFFATYGDGLGDVDLRELLDTHRRSGGLSTVTTVPLRSQYGTVEFDAEGRVMAFREKPVIDNCWINAGFFVFERDVFRHWQGTNLERHVLPELAARETLYTYRHKGFWKSMDTSKDQAELEQIYLGGEPPWIPAAYRPRAAVNQ
jgi:glucose-1-phosphate cytidylyltransferase